MRILAEKDPLRKMRIFHAFSSQFFTFTPSFSLCRRSFLSLSTFFSLPFASGSKSLAAAFPTASNQIHCRSVLCRTSIFRLGLSAQRCPSLFSLHRHTTSRAEARRRNQPLLCFSSFSRHFFSLSSVWRSPFSPCAVAHGASCMSVKAWEENSDIDACC